MIDRRVRALVVIHFPMRHGEMDWADARDTGMALKQVGEAIATGSKTPIGTVIVPFQERTEMKVSMDLTGPSGKMWELDMKYHRLPPEYTAEIAAVARSFAALIENTPATGGSGPSYGVAFKCEAEGEELEGLAAPMLAVVKENKAAKRGFKYSEAIKLQDAGIVLLQQLQAGAHREIVSGQRA